MSARPAQTVLLRGLLDHAIEPLLAVDAAGTILDANAAAAACLGRRREHLVGKPFAALVGLADERFRAAAAGLAAGELQTLETEDAAGTSSRRLELALVEPTGAIAVAIRSGARPAEGRDASDALESTFARLPTAVVQLQHDRTVAFANAAAFRVFHGMRVGEPLPLEPSPAIERYARRLAERDGPRPPQVVRLEDGRALRVSGTGAPDGSGVLVLTDVTPLIRQVDAQRAFVRNAAHQLRTPLAGIASAIEVLQAGAKDDAPAERDRFLDHIARETERLTRLARALLVLARAQAGAQTPRLEFVAIAPLLERIGTEVHHSPAVAIEVAAPHELAAFAEPDLLDEAIRALADNAARHTREGSVTLRARRCGERLLEIEIADTGEGILPEHLESIFEPFFRAAPDGTGFGLGLAIAHQAVTAMGGELTVTSEPRAGTRFLVRVPSAEIVGG